MVIVNWELIIFIIVARERIITALDLGSHKVRAGVLLVNSNEDLKVIGFGESQSRGFRRGQVIDLKEAVDSIKEAVAAASKSGNVKISRVSLAVGGTHFKMTKVKGAIAVSRADGEISREDVARVLEAAKSTSVIPPNREVVHTLPIEYKIDSEEKIKDPVGMRGIRLEVEAVLILGSTPVLKFIRKAVQDVGLEIEDLVYAPLAASRAVLSKKQKELGSLSLDIGGTTTSLSIWQESDLKFSSVLPIGSSYITYDVAVGLRVAPELSEKIKTEYGSCILSNVSRREQVVLADWGSENMVVPKWELTRIIEARAGEIFDMVAEELKNSGQAGLLPAGVVVSGGGAKMEGIVELAKKKLKLPTELGRVREIKSDFNEFFSSETATLAGLLLYERDREREGEHRTKINSVSSGSGFWTKVKSWFVDLMP